MCGDHEFHAGSEPDAMSAQPIQPASEPPPPLVPREWRLRLDPLLLLATLGLVACSLIALKGATQHDIAGRPALLRQAPGDLRRRRARADVRRLAAGLLAAARAALPDLRAADRSRCSACSALATATRGAKSWIPLPGFNLQPSELGKVLLVVALAGFLVDRMRAMGRDTTARIMLLGLIPTMLVMAEPDLGSAHGLRRRHARDAVRRRRAVAALRRARSRCSRSAIALVLVVGADGWASRCSSPTRWTA